MILFNKYRQEHKNFANSFESSLTGKYMSENLREAADTSDSLSYQLSFIYNSDLRNLRICKSLYEQTDRHWTEKYARRSKKVMSE